jgi:hypothetical protein
VRNASSLRSAAAIAASALAQERDQVADDRVTGVERRLAG